MDSTSRNFRPCVWLFVFLTFIAFPPVLFAQSDDWERVVKSKARRLGGYHPFVALHDVADALNARTYFSDKARKAILYLDEEKITVTAFSPFVLIGKRVVQMPVPVEYFDGELWLPVQYFLPFLKDAVVVSGSESYSNGNADITGQANVLGVRVEKKANGTLIRVLTGHSFDRSSLSTRYSRKWLYLDIVNGRIVDGQFPVHIDPGLVEKVVPVQLDQLVQLSFRLNRDISEGEIHVSVQRREIWISIPTRGGLPADFLKRLEADREKWRIDRVVIDPGHGGRDPGAIGPRGVYEKDVVLGIAKHLKKLLEKKLKIDVVMTRESDVFVPLKERTKIANHEQGKLFISIHANSNASRYVDGATTYFLGLAKSEEALEIAQRENAAIQYETDASGYDQLSDESIILATMAQNDFNKESQDLAAMIQEEIRRRAGFKDRGVKQAGFYVLVGASMPNVLVETAFISNSREERMLKSSSYQKKIAEAIFESIKRFKEKYERAIK